MIKFKRWSLWISLILLILITALPACNDSNDDDDSSDDDATDDDTEDDDAAVDDDASDDDATDDDTTEDDMAADDDDDADDDDFDDDDDDDDMTGLDCFYIEKFNDIPPPGWTLEGDGWTRYWYEYGAYAAHVQTGGTYTQAIDSILYSYSLDLSAYTVVKIGFPYVVSMSGSTSESFPDVTLELSENPATDPWDPIWNMAEEKWTEGPGIKEVLIDLSAYLPGTIHLGWRFKADANLQNIYNYYLYELYECGI